MNSEAYERIRSEYSAACERSSALSQQASGIILAAQAEVRAAALRGDITNEEKDTLLRKWVSSDSGAEVKSSLAVKAAAVSG